MVYDLTEDAPHFTDCLCHDACFILVLEQTCIAVGLSKIQLGGLLYDFSDLPDRISNIAADDDTENDADDQIQDKCT